MTKNVPMVFLHGWACGPGIWVSQEKYFSARDIIKVNYHHGIKDAKLDDWPSLYATSAWEAVNKLTDSQVVLAGWSLGAMITIEMTLMIPQKVAGLVLAGGTARFTKEPGYDGGLPKILVQKTKKNLARNTGQTLESFYSMMFTPKEREAGDLELFRKYLSIASHGWSEEELLAGLDYLIDRDFRTQLKDIKVPSLVIHGEKDDICPPQAAHYLHENLNNAQLKMLTDCGHVPFYSKTEEFYETIRRWFDDLDRQRTN